SPALIDTASPVSRALRAATHDAAWRAEAGAATASVPVSASTANASRGRAGRQRWNRANSKFIGRDDLRVAVQRHDGATVDSRRSSSCLDPSTGAAGRGDIPMADGRKVEGPRREPGKGAQTGRPRVPAPLAAAAPAGRGA